MLYLDGGLQQGVMTLCGTARDCNVIEQQRIRWTPVEDGSAWQHWEAFQDANGRWDTLFDGTYRRIA